MKTGIYWSERFECMYLYKGKKRFWKRLEFYLFDAQWNIVFVIPTDLQLIWEF